MKKRLLCMLSAAVTAAASVPAFAESSEDGFYHRLGEDNTLLEGWNADGAGAYECKENEDGSLSAQWNSIVNCMTLHGKSYEEPISVPEQYDISYALETEAMGVSYFGVYGMLDNPQTEFYIVDGWTGWDPFEGSTAVKTVTLGGVQYDLFAGQQQTADPVHGEPRTVWTYWNVRRENQWPEGEKAVYAGTVPVAEHLRAWEGTDYLTTEDYQLSQATAAVIAWGTGAQRAAGVCTLKKPFFTIGDTSGQTPVIPGKDYLFREKQADGTILEGWNQSGIGSYSCKKQSDGSFTAEWSGVHDCETSIGWYYDEPVSMPEHYDVSYEIEAEAEGYCYFGLDGWLANPQSQFYILDGWSGWDPRRGQEPLATLESNGVKYDLYVFYKDVPGDLVPREVNPDFWSIRQDNLFREGEKSTIRATVSLDDHLNVLEDLGYLTAGDYQLAAATVWTEDFGGGTNNASGSCTIRKPVLTVNAEREQKAAVIGEIPPVISAISDDLRVQTDSDGTFRIGWNQSRRGEYDFTVDVEKEITGTWKDTENSLFWSGIQFPDPKSSDQMGTIRLTYDAEIASTEGSCWYGVMGYTDGETPIEFFVIDGWSGSKPTGGLEPITTVEIGGVKYDIYRQFHELYHGIENNYGYMQYYSIRQENAFTAPEGMACKGTVLLNDHIRAWDSTGLNFEQFNLKSLFFAVDGSCYVYDGKGQFVSTKSSGSCTVKKPEIVTGEPAGDDTKALTGDANCDGAVDISDAVLVMRFAVQDKDAVITDRGLKTADTDKNGKTDDSDVVLILMHIAKKIVLT